MLEQGELANALVAFSDGKVIAEAILQSTPDSLQAQRDLSFSWSYMGKTAFYMEDCSQAEACYARALAYREAIAESDRSNFASQIDLASVLVKLAQVEIKLGRSEGLDRMHKALALLGSLDSKALEASMEAREILDEAEQAIAESSPPSP